MSTSRYRPGRARRQRLEAAFDAGLIAAGNVIAEDVRRRFRERDFGYTSGAFAHELSGVASKIVVVPPHTVNRQRRVMVTTTAVSPKGAPYPLYWEVGHQNLFTRKFERVETFRPALDDNRHNAERAFQDTVRRRMGGMS